MTPLEIENGGRPAPLTNLRVGCAGWTIPREFAAQFPATGSHLERYSQVLNCAEINSSFYRPHKPQTWERWRDSVPDNFLFSVKAPKAITHEAKLNCPREELEAFFQQLKNLEPKLGPVLFQLPPSLQFQEPLATKFLAMIRDMHPGNVVLEPRHESWFRVETEELLKSFQIARVAADPACVPTAFHPGGWDGLRYYRLHGSPRRYYSTYSSEFLQNIAEATKAEFAAKTWCIFDNTASGAAMGNALELRQMSERY